MTTDVAIPSDSTLPEWLRKFTGWEPAPVWCGGQLAELTISRLWPVRRRASRRAGSARQRIRNDPGRRRANFRTAGVVVCE